MVATTKLRRLQDRALASRPYATRIAEMMQRVAPAHRSDALAAAAGPARPVSARPWWSSGPTAACAAPTTPTCSSSAAPDLRALEAEGVEPRLFVFGRKVKSYLRKLHESVRSNYAHDGALEKMSSPTRGWSSRTSSRRFCDGEVQRVSVVYTRLLSAGPLRAHGADACCRSTAEAAGAGGGDEDEGGQDFILEPSPRPIIDRLLPALSSSMQLYAAMLESLDQRSSPPAGSR